MNYTEIKQLDEEHIANTYARFDVCIESGKGAVCTDINNKNYIDFTSGIGVNSLGFCDSEWVKAVCDQAQKLNHTSNLYYTEPCIALAKKLCEKSGFKKVFFANSGAEANEGAIKAARKYSCDKYGEGRNEIITLVNSFHGRTVTTLAATGQESFHKYFSPFTGGFVYAQANNLSSLENAISSKTCAVMIELVQGEGGVNALEPNFVSSVAKLCEKKDILLIADEVQTGIGRTGKLFAYEHFGISPDIVTAAKGLGGGLPIGAVLLGEKTMAVLTAGTHGSTFGANPICCAAALSVLNNITDEFLYDISKKSKLFREKLLQIKEVNGVSGIGLMVGVEVLPLSAREIAEKCLEKGLLVLTAKDKIRFLAPLNIGEAEINKGLTIFEQVLSEFS